ncbi:hypothetical protein [Halanaerobium congolense]|uniref:hypothetical protein n=1 Tax=Halanaerobium congolense TaxID=54121 RepID=UPI00115F7944|nr:hypothetical protein [Halanaerobium congolense]
MSIRENNLDNITIPESIYLDTSFIYEMLANGENSIAAVDGYFINVPHINSYGPSWVFQEDQNSTFKEDSDDIIDDIFEEYDSLNS